MESRLQGAGAAMGQVLCVTLQGSFLLWGHWKPAMETTRTESPVWVTVPQTQRYWFPPLLSSWGRRRLVLCEGLSVLSPRWPPTS